MSHHHTMTASAAIQRALLGVTAHSAADIFCR
ncbi:Ms4533A family Cys-rich leader peptide [Streptomyces sp. NPDC085612]